MWINVNQLKNSQLNVRRCYTGYLWSRSWGATFPERFFASFSNEGGIILISAAWDPFLGVSPLTMMDWRCNEGDGEGRQWWSGRVRVPQSEMTGHDWNISGLGSVALISCRDRSWTKCHHSRFVWGMAMTSYNDIDFEADDFTLPPQVDTNFTVPSRLVSTTATNGPTLPIQIDEEVVVKNKRKPAVKLIDRFLPHNIFWWQTSFWSRIKTFATWGATTS